MDVDQGMLSIWSEKYTTRLLTDDGYDDFPTVEDAWKTNEFFPLTSDFQRGVTACAKIAKSAREYENVLKSVHFVNERIEASDGFRAVCYYVKTNTDEALISGQALSSILKYRLASYAYTDTDMYLKTDNDVFFVIPKSNEDYGDRVYTITHQVDTTDAIPVTNGADIISALERVSIMADTFNGTNNKSVKFRFSENQVKLIGESDMGNANETVAITYAGNNLQFSTCPEYVISALEETTQMVLSENLMFLFNPSYKCALVIQ
jgi:DNA polymerase III sliding clamp (beta) subunit (PCNA family)